MTDHVVGIVSKITSKEAGKNKNLIWSICVEEDGQEDTWFGYGWDEPDFTEGAEIEFDIEYNGDYLNVDVDSLNVIADGEPKRSSRKPAGRSSGRSSGSGRSSNSRNSKPAGRGKPAGRSKPAAKRGGGTDDKMSKDEWADKDKMIRRQSCMNTAINLVKLLNEAGVLAKPTKKSAGADALIALCDEEAERLYDQYEEQVYGGGTAKRGRGRQEEDDYSDDIPD